MGLLGDIVGGITGFANLRAQKENLDWQRDAQKTTWQREDTAVQRRVADLEAAGLNPVLAAGSGAESSAPIRTEAPQMQSVGDLDVLGAMLQKQALKKSSAEISRTKAETDRIRAEVDLAERKEMRDAKYQQALMRNLAVTANKDVLQSQNIGIENRFLAREKNQRIQKLVEETGAERTKNRYLAKGLENQITQQGLKISEDSLNLAFLERKLNQEATIRGQQIDREEVERIYRSGTLEAKRTLAQYQASCEKIGQQFLSDTLADEKLLRKERLALMQEQTGIAIIEKALRQGDKDALDAMGISEIMYTGMFAQGASVGHLIGSGVNDFKENAKNLWNKLFGGRE